jgi:Chloride channel protein EriC
MNLISPRTRRKTRVLWLSPRHWRRRLVFGGGAVAVGAAAVLFAEGSEYVHRLFREINGASAYLPLLLSPLGLALVVWATRRFFPGSQGSGIPQTIAALKMAEPAERQKVLSLRIAFGKIGLTLLALLSGASVGREGPTVQIGASLMHAFGSWARFSRYELERGLILAGGAAGVAAAFNTPLAGVVFAIEEMSRSFEQRTSGTILTAVVAAGVVSLAVLGNYTYFGHTAAALSLDRGWLAVLLCGVAGGVLGGGFSRMLIGAARGLPGLPGRLMRERPVAFAALCGLALALIGLASGGVTYGTGYQEARAILEGSAALPESYGLMKLLATVVSYLSGSPGGIFAPSLAVGAGFGQNLASLMPYAPAGAVVVLGMVGYFAGVVQAPITAFVIVMEMTDSHEMILPLMATAFLGHAVSRLVCHRPLYKALAEGFLARSQETSPSR